MVDRRHCFAARVHLHDSWRAPTHRNIFSVSLHQKGFSATRQLGASQTQCSQWTSRVGNATATPGMRVKDERVSSVEGLTRRTERRSRTCPVTGHNAEMEEKSVGEPIGVRMKGCSCLPPGAGGKHVPRDEVTKAALTMRLVTLVYIGDRFSHHFTHTTPKFFNFSTPKKAFSACDKKPWH